MKARPAVRIMVVDDHPAFRIGLIELVESEPGFKVVAEAGNGSEAVELYRKVAPDVVLMDLRLPGLSGVEAIQLILREFPEGRIIVVTNYETDEDVYRALQAGAKSYLLKDMSQEEIIGAIRDVYSGTAQLPERVSGLLDNRKKRPELTRKEMEVMDLLVKGRSNKEIGDELGLTETAVKARFRALFFKLQAKDRTDAVLNAIRYGIVNL